MDEELNHLLPLLRILARRFYHECKEANLETDDLAQETILKAFRYQDKIPAGEPDRQRWVMCMMANLLRDKLAAEQAGKRGGGRVYSLDQILSEMTTSGRRLEEIQPTREAGPRTMAQRRDARRHIATAIEALPEDQRHAITLHLVHQFTVEETAASMNRTEGQVRGYVQRGRQQLQVELKDLWEQR